MSLAEHLTAGDLEVADRGFENSWQMLDTAAVPDGVLKELLGFLGLLDTDLPVFLRGSQEEIVKRWDGLRPVRDGDGTPLTLDHIRGRLFGEIIFPGEYLCSIDQEGVDHYRLVSAHCHFRVNTPIFYELIDLHPDDLTGSFRVRNRIYQQCMLSPSEILDKSFPASGVNNFIGE
jgi:hypothetical protein